MMLTNRSTVNLLLSQFSPLGALTGTVPLSGRIRCAPELLPLKSLNWSIPIISRQSTLPNTLCVCDFVDSADPDDPNRGVLKNCELD